jgi:hypothetical protein
MGCIEGSLGENSRVPCHFQPRHQGFASRKLIQKANLDATRCVKMSRNAPPGKHYGALFV